MSETAPLPDASPLDRGPDAPPLYRQLIRELRTVAESVGAGERFPSERELIERYDVSRITVQQAIADLVRSGHLRRQQGRGTFVAEPKIERPLQATNSFSEDMRQKGFTPSSELVSYEVVKANARLSRELGVDAGDDVVLIERLMLADDEPMAVHQTYLRADRCQAVIERNLDELWRGGSLYDILENRGGLELAEAEETVEAAQASAEIADLLGILAGEPILWIVRRTRLADGAVLELSEMSYRGDRYRLTLHTTRRATS